MNCNSRPGRRLRAAMDSADLVLAPGCGDVLTARLIEQAGFGAAYISGLWAAASLGLQDYGLITMTEMASHASYIARNVDIPVVADVDAGFGSPLNVGRCVSEFERAGVAAIHLEDQLLPKKCGLMPGKAVIEVDEMVKKIEGAVSGRRDCDLVIIAKTDALGEEGLDGVVQRGRAYAEAGADMLFVEAIKSIEQARLIADAFKDRYLLFSVAAEGYGPAISLEEISELGYHLVKYPAHLLLAGLATQRRVLMRLKVGEALAGTELMKLDELFALIGNIEAHATH